MTLSLEQIFRAYTSVRTAVLARHVALGRHYRADLLSLDTLVAPGITVDAVSAQDPATQELTRWNRSAEDRENPLMAGGALMAFLAAEEAVGLTPPGGPLRAVMQGLARHYRSSGDHADGYPVRWDAPTSQRWEESATGPIRSRNFLYRSDGGYDYAPPPADPRWAQLRTEATLKDLAGPREVADAQFAQREFFDWYRRAEPSMDELCGLVGGYAVAGRLSTDPLVRGAVTTQTNRLGDYLAENGYLLVRPGGGFTARGSAGILPALELPFARALGLLGAMDATARTGFVGACERAGVWAVLKAPFERWSVAGAVLGALAPVRAALTPLGLAPLLDSGSLTSAQLGQVLAVYLHRDSFDVSNDTMAQEFAIAAALHLLSPSERYHLWIHAAAGFGGGWAGGFPPYIGLTAIDDPDRQVADSYLGWFGAKRGSTSSDAGGVAGRSCLAAGVACLLGGGPAAEQSLATRVEEVVTALGGPDHADLRLLEMDGNTWEELKAGLDLLAGVALGWLHARRSSAAGTPVVVPGFPVPPAGFTLPEAAVPAAVVARGGDNLPMSATQGGTPVAEPDGSVLLRWDVGRPVPDPVALVPASPTALVFDGTFMVGRSNRDLPTFAVLREGDEFAIDVSGQVDGHGPDGTDQIADDARLPVHVGTDPARAKIDALVMRINGYTIVGSGLPRRPWLYHAERMIYLRLNRDGRAGIGTGTFSVRVRVWSDAGELVKYRFVSCVHRDSTDRDRRIDRIGGANRDGTRWHLTMEEALGALDNQVRMFVLTARGTGTEVLPAKRRGVRFLRSVPDGVRGTNLSAIGPCAE